jgi:uncharacterized BrkB/YihY/UPF0761 family membrane protein
MMPPKLIDKEKWDKITFYIDIITVFVFVASLYLLTTCAILMGFYHYEMQQEGTMSASEHYYRAYWQFLAAVIIIALILFWLYYRYFKARARSK